MNRHSFFGGPLVAIAFALAGTFVHAKSSSPFGTRDQPGVVDKGINDLVITAVDTGKLPVKVFKVGRIGEPGQPTRGQLLAVFQIFQSQYAAAENGGIIPAAPWMKDGLAEITVTLRKEPAQGLYCLGGDAEHCVFVSAPGPEPVWTVGDKLRFYAYKTGLQEWAEPGGPAHHSPLYEPLTLPLAAAGQNPPSREQFVSALRAGQSFDILTATPPAAGDKAALPVLAVQKLVW